MPATLFMPSLNMSEEQAPMVQRRGEHGTASQASGMPAKSTPDHSDKLFNVIDKEATLPEAASVVEELSVDALLERSAQVLNRRYLLHRRSYSVMDTEPLPHYHRPSSRLALMDLPNELHFAIFDFLDMIDSTCLGPE